MAGDWIKMRTDLWDDPRVVRLVSTLQVDRASIIGRLYRLWALADQYTEDGRLIGYTAADLDTAVDLAGFSAALEDLDWLTIDAAGVSVPRFDEHNGESAKKRAQAKNRMAKKRSKDSGRCAVSVTKAQPEKRRGREEKELFDHIRISLEEARIDLQKIARAIGRPQRDDDRLLCVRAAILRQTTYNENWLCDSLAAVANVEPTPKAPFNYLRTCLATKAASLPPNITGAEKTQAVADLNDRLRQVVIPADLQNWPRDLPDSERTVDDAIQNTLKPIGHLKAS